MNSRVPVLVEWSKGHVDPAVKDTAHTRVVNFYGCLLVSPRALDLDQSLRLTNLATKQSIDATVVWRGKKHLDGWELGIELASPEMDFWGVEL